MVLKLDSTTGKWAEDGKESGEDAESDNVAAITYVKDMTDDQLRLLAREKLSEALQAISPAKQPDLAVRLSNAILDRVEGKAVQRIDQRVLHAHKGIPGDMTNEELLLAIREMQHQLPAGVKLLKDGTLDLVDVTPNEESIG